MTSSPRRIPVWSGGYRLGSNLKRNVPQVVTHKYTSTGTGWIRLCWLIPDIHIVVSDPPSLQTPPAQIVHRVVPTEASQSLSVAIVVCFVMLHEIVAHYVVSYRGTGSWPQTRLAKCGSAFIFPISHASRLLLLPIVFTCLQLANFKTQVNPEVKQIWFLCWQSETFMCRIEQQTCLQNSKRCWCLEKFSTSWVQATFA